MATLATIAPDAIEAREIADLSAQFTTVLTASLASAITTNSGTAPPSGAAFTAAVASLVSSLNAGVLIALAQARGLNYNIA
jgi:hypothetical protein